MLWGGGGGCKNSRTWRVVSGTTSVVKLPVSLKNVPFPQCPRAPSVGCIHCEYHPRVSVLHNFARIVRLPGRFSCYGLTRVRPRFVNEVLTIRKVEVLLSASHRQDQLCEKQNTSSSPWRYNNSGGVIAQLGGGLDTAFAATLVR